LAAVKIAGGELNVSDVTVTLDEKNPDEEEQPTRAHIIVVGNAKGGSGKSTTAMHIVISLLTMGFKVGAIDLDGKQKTLGRYIENREAFIAKKKLTLPMPMLRVIARAMTRNTIQKINFSMNSLLVQIWVSDRLPVFRKNGDLYYPSALSRSRRSFPHLK
tara:strand:- start:401 stop:880 length:480 start_codon:yes stop_codon:yes gene_type:complete